MPLRLTRRDAKRLTLNRQLVQPPSPGSALPSLGQSEGIPGDVLLTLEALRQLADQGNLIARAIYERERERLGIDRRLFSLR
jgi:hypothetical protein